MPGANDDSTLSALTSTAGVLEPAFDPAVLSYTVHMPYTSYETPTRTVTPTTNVAGAHVFVNTVEATSGTPCATTFISVGNNVFTITVDSQNNHTHTTYTLTVMRAAASTDSSLSAISISAANLSPSFASATYNYTANVSYDVTSTTVTAVVSNANAKIIIEGNTATSGVASNQIELRVGVNYIVITCTAEDDITLSTYTLAVVRADIDDSVELMKSKSYAIGGEISNTQVLKDFAVNELTLVSQIQTLSDCTKNLPHRLMELALRKAEDLILGNPLAQDIIAQLDALNALYNNIKNISELANPKLTKEETLIEALLLAKSLTGIDLVQKINDILNKFGDVVGIDNLIVNLYSLNLCDITNYGPSGVIRPNPTRIPLDTPPPVVEGVANPVGIMSYDSKPKDDYDAFMFQLKEHLNKDPQRIAALSGIDLEKYNRMLSLLNTLAYSYHDNISRTVDDSKDEQYKTTYLKLVADELSKHPEWDAATKLDYNGRADVIGNEIGRNVKVIRAYYTRNSAATGEWIPLYMTSYGSAAIDKTTANDISQGKITASDQFNGAYGVPLVQGTSVASNYFKGKTVLEIRYAKDGSPVGSGRVTVHDTGGMSNNVIDYYCGDDMTLYKSIAAAGINTNGKTKPGDAAPIEVRVVSGGPKDGKTI
jgi:hypothetical protein